MSQKSDIKIVYKWKYAAEMIAMGHKLLGTMPDPVNPKYTVYIFEDAETFYEDLHNVIERGRRIIG